MPQKKGGLKFYTMSSTRICCGRVKASWRSGNIKISDRTTDIWKIKVRKEQLLPLNILSPDEQLKASGFFHEKDRISFLTRRTALRILLSKYLGIEAAGVEFLPGENKKPIIKPDLNSGLQFNLSHSGDLVLIAISDSAVGIDVERSDPDFNFEEVLVHSFSEQEIEFINRSGNRRQLFYELWTRKEALIKASSKGIDDDLAKIPCLEGVHILNSRILNSEEEWCVSSFLAEDGYAGSIAYNGSEHLNFLNFRFDL